MLSNNAPLIEARGLKKHFQVTKGLVLRKTVGLVKAVDGVDLTIRRGETLGLVGESGCGKTTASRLVLLLLKPTAGSLSFGGEDLFAAGPSAIARYRRSVQAVFQDPYSSLDPRMRVGDSIAEPLRGAGKVSRAEAQERVAAVIEQVGLPARCATLYPHEFSGGQRQRIAIARALAPRPECIVLDEPISALDVSIRAQILKLMKDLQAKTGVSYLVIAHDLAAVKYISQRIGVMYLGKLVEIADSRELYARPLHPYTQALLSAALPAHPDAPRTGIVLGGEVPSPLNPPPGCRFHPRCPIARPLCSEDEPQLKDMGGGMVACHEYELP
ncbi:MAG: ATP-binding cassette domain-containing protein [Chloroflexota bacterium]|nr:MAG: ATP-binding cassette domain-containing protein [Chloroflexota bacterium]